MREPDRFISNNASERERVDLLNDIFLEAAISVSADVHFQIHGNGVRIRRRAAGGELVEIGQYAREVGTLFDQKIRSRSRMSLSERHMPLDGRMSLRFPEHNRVVDIRVSVVPTIEGESIVCRLLDQSNVSLTLKELSFSTAIDESMRAILREPHGLFLVTGPTGSGKTTTLYALIHELNNKSLNIVTIENPVEYRIPGLNQVNIDPIHMSYPNALRSILRQDPDVIMVGEIRDAETAKIAVEAANTGHLVMATMHANNSAQSITRLIDLGVDPGTLAISLRGVSAQRLLRKIAPQFLEKSEPEAINDLEREWMAVHGLPFMNDHFYRPLEIFDYQGHFAVIEMIVGDEMVRRCISGGGGMEDIFAAAARQPQFEMLSYATVSKAHDGMTSLEEARRVTSSADAIRLEYKRIGYSLVEGGLASAKDVEKAISIQTGERINGRSRALGEILEEMGICTREQIRVMVGDG